MLRRSNGPSNVTKQRQCSRLVAKMPVAIIAEDPEGYDGEQSTSSGIGKPHSPLSSDVYHCSKDTTKSSQLTMMQYKWLKREVEGRCGDCGVQTHEIQRDLVSRDSTKVPLTIENEVHRGRCLFCYPLKGTSDGLQSTLSQHSPAPEGLSVPLSISDNSITDRTVIWSGCWSSPGTMPLAIDILRILSMLFHSSDLSVQQAGCERLWILSWEEENAATIGRVGGIPIILRAMSTFPSNSRLQQCACECLQNLTSSLEQDSLFNARQICESNGIGLIVQAMIQYPMLAGIQQSGCTALANIVRSFRLSTSSEGEQWHYCKSCCSCIQRLGGLQAIISAAETFRDEYAVASAAQDALKAMEIIASIDSDAMQTPGTKSSSMIEDDLSENHTGNDK